MNPLRNFIRNDKYSWNKAITTGFNDRFAYKLIHKGDTTHIISGRYIKETDVPQIVKGVLALDTDYRKALPHEKKQIEAQLYADVLSDVRSDIESYKRRAYT